MIWECGRCRVNNRPAASASPLWDDSHATAVMLAFARIFQTQPRRLQIEISDFCELSSEWDWRCSNFMPHLEIRVHSMDSLSAPFISACVFAVYCVCWLSTQGRFKSIKALKLEKNKMRVLESFEEVIVLQSMAFRLSKARQDSQMMTCRATRWCSG